MSEQLSDGSFGPAVLVPDLSSPLNENRPTIRHDGLEIFFHSNRAGSMGTAFDLWVATRESTLDAWSTPVNLGDPINTAFQEQQAYLSSDNQTLFFSSNRPGGFGGLDLHEYALKTPRTIRKLTTSREMRTTRMPFRAVVRTFAPAAQVSGF
jgi:WD40-like Beta Propeller Repeat